MSVAVCRSESGAAHAAEALVGIRAEGGIQISFENGVRGTFAKTYYEFGGYRVRFPRNLNGTEAILINTAGGMAGGDKATFRINAPRAVNATLTTQAAERVYRSLGSTTIVDTQMNVGPDAMLCWLPQETIIFAGARLNRRIEADVTNTSRLLMAECFVFGRAAMGERLLTGALHDNWRIRRDGKLIFADAVRLGGSISYILDRPAVAAGANALATVLYISPDADDRLDDVRLMLTDAQSNAAASAWNGLLCVRYLAQGTRTLRRDLARLAAHLSGRPVSRVWELGS